MMLPYLYQKLLLLLVGTYIIVSVFLFINNPLITGITITILLVIVNFVSHDIHFNTIIEISRVFIKKIKLTDFLAYFLMEILGGYLAVKTYEYFNRK